jgi:4-diphosphocytidyl-2-C-methyl-D-erythritol kinase
MFSSHTLTLPAPAKLNLFLHITGRRPDGYHELQTVFQLLDFGDELSFAARDDGELTLATTGPQSLGDVPAEHNLVLKAARALRDHVGRHDLGADIRLTKRIPTGGGLGGGSSDAASTLLALNRLWGLKLDDDALADLGKRLGADVPVFVRGRSAWAEGIGERLTPVELPSRWFVIIHPGCHVSTQAVFTHPELTRNTPAITIPAFFAGPSRNDCENLVRKLAEPVDKALIFLNKFGEARLTGTGACVFAGFDDEGTARQVAREVRKPWSAVAARGVNVSTARAALDAWG